MIGDVGLTTKYLRDIAVGTIPVCFDESFMSQQRGFLLNMVGVGGQLTPDTCGIIQPVASLSYLTRRGINLVMLLSLS